MSEPAKNAGCGGLSIDPAAAPGPIRLASSDESPDGIERWVVTRYEDAVAALSDLRLSNQNAYGSPGTAQAHEGDLLTGTMIGLDPPDHARLRRLVVRSFSAKRIEALRPRVRQIADDLLDALAGQETTDIVTTYAFPLPVQVISELLGIPPDVHEHLLRQATAADSATDSTIRMIPQATVTAAMENLIDQHSTQQHTQQSTQPPGDLLTTLITAQADGQLSHRELVQTAALLFTAGHVTTVYLIGGGIATLLHHPEQLDELRRDPTLVSSAVDELLRHAGPVPSIPRYALQDVNIGGTTIPAGSHVTVALTTANHDPAAFTNPSSFDIHRDIPGDVAFGHGIHFCLGARLAKLEAEIAIATLLRRFPTLALAKPATPSTSGMLGVDELHVRLGKPTPAHSTPSSQPLPSVHHHPKGQIA